MEDQIKRACNFDRNELLTKGKPARKQVLSLNIEYNPAFSKLSGVLKELDCILQGDEEHRKIFNDTPLVGFSNGKSLKNLLVRAVLPKQKLENNFGSEKCGRANCEVCLNIKNTSEFSSHKTGEKFTIEKGPLNCNSPKVIYLKNCKVCGIQNVGSTENKYRKRFNVYKSVQRQVREKLLGELPKATKRGRPKQNSEDHSYKGKKEIEKKYAQEKFHKHFCQEGHKGIEDWEVILIDSAHSEKSLRSKELFWQYKLKTFHPDGLNEVEAIVDTT